MLEPCTIVLALNLNLINFSSDCSHEKVSDRYLK